MIEWIINLTVVGILLLMSVLIKFFKTYNLISGYNSASPEEQQYMVEKGKKRAYCHNEKDLDALMEEFGRQGTQVKRFKGLGEMNDDQLWDTTMNPETRSMKLVSIDDAAAAEEVFSMLMGDKVEPRREFIETHAREAKYLDI